MRHDYPDITGAMNRLLRAAHRLLRDRGAPSAQCEGDVDPATGDCRCAVRAAWWDEHGAPRFAEHHPSLCPDPYALEVALVVVACQQCDQLFRMQISRGSRDHAAPTPRILWAAINRRGALGVGDPPRHGCAGDSMNASNLRVAEFWLYNRKAPLRESQWLRDPAFEVELVVVKDPPLLAETLVAELRPSEHGHAAEMVLADGAELSALEAAALIDAGRTFYVVPAPGTAARDAYLATRMPVALQAGDCVRCRARVAWLRP